MAQPYSPPPNSYGAPASNLQFYSSTYPTPPSSYGYGAPSGSMSSPPQNGGAGGYGYAPSPSSNARVSGRMGESGGLRTGWLAAFSTEGYEGEPSLQEELGVNFGHIREKTVAVLNPFRGIDRHLMDDSDLAGPILFFFLVGGGFFFAPFVFCGRQGKGGGRKGNRGRERKRTRDRMIKWLNTS